MARWTRRPNCPSLGRLSPRRPSSRPRMASKPRRRSLITRASLRRYRPNVGVVLARSDGKVWLGRRADAPGVHNWQFPQGGIDSGESLEAAALRELAEETGIV